MKLQEYNSCKIYREPMLLENTYLLLLFAATIGNWNLGLEKKQWRYKFIMQLQNESSHADSFGSGAELK